MVMRSVFNQSTLTDVEFLFTCGCMTLLEGKKSSKDIYAGLIAFQTTCVLLAEGKGA